MCSQIIGVHGESFEVIPVRVCEVGKVEGGSTITETTVDGSLGIAVRSRQVYNPSGV